MCTSCRCGQGSLGGQPCWGPGLLQGSLPFTGRPRQGHCSGAPGDQHQRTKAPPSPHTSAVSLSAAWSTAGSGPCSALNTLRWAGGGSGGGAGAHCCSGRAATPAGVVAVNNLQPRQAAHRTGRAAFTLTRTLAPAPQPADRPARRCRLALCGAAGRRRALDGRGAMVTHCMGLLVSSAHTEGANGRDPT